MVKPIRNAVKYTIKVFHLWPVCLDSSVPVEPCEVLHYGFT